MTNSKNNGVPCDTKSKYSFKIGWKTIRKEKLYILLTDNHNLYEFKASYYNDINPL